MIFMLTSSIVFSASVFVYLPEQRIESGAKVACASSLLHRFWGCDFVLLVTELNTGMDNLKLHTQNTVFCSRIHGLQTH